MGQRDRMLSCLDWHLHHRRSTVKMTYSPFPTWSTRPGVIFRMTLLAYVVDEDNETIVIPRGTLLMTMGACTFVFMETQRVFRVDELDARIIEFEAELLC